MSPVSRELSFSRVPRVRRLHDLVAGLAKRAAKCLQNLLFIVDEQDGAAQRGHREAELRTLDTLIAAR